MGFGSVADVLASTTGVFTAAGVTASEVGVVLGAIAAVGITAYAVLRMKKGIAG